ncbi:sulfatase-like hydrolase/transferase, partial [candidate division KSB1 bacterium]|nr:sulfatase-like hydrolase/transferase [candidate division KSB1 bacterium]
MGKNYIIKNTLDHAVVLILAFLLFGLVEIYSNVIFKLVYIKVFPNQLYTHLLPLLLMYLLKSMRYAVVFLLFVAVSALAYNTILMFVQTADENARRSLSARIQNILTALYDLFIPAMLIYILFFQYGGGPVTLSYYFYFLNDATSTILKNLSSFELNLLIKLILSFFIAFIFIRFRAAKYARHHIFIALILVTMAILPNLTFLLHHISDLPARVGLIFLIVVLFITVLLLLRRLFAAGIPRWAEIGWTLMFILLIPATIYLFSATKNSRPNIVHIILDTLRMKSFNEKTMPFLFSLKDKGIYFPNSYSSSDNTVTSHNAIYYGKHPSNIGMEHGPFPARTIMDVLRTNEYHTIVVSANGRFCIVNGFDKGVDDFYEAWKGENHVRNIQLMADYGLSEKFAIIENSLAYYTDKYLNKGHPIDKKPMGNREYRYFNYEPAKIVNEFVKHVIEKNSPSTPFYLFVNYLDPHTPYLAPTAEKISAVVGRLKTCLPGIYEKLGFEHIALSDSM